LVFRPYERRTFDPETFPPAVLSLAEAIEDVLEERINRLEQAALRAEAEGNQVKAKDKRAQKSRYRISNITKRLGKSTFEELLKGRITRVPPRRDLLALGEALDCSPVEINHLLHTIESLPPPAREILPPSTPARPSLFRRIVEALEFPAYVVGSQSSLEQVNDAYRVLWRVPNEGLPPFPRELSTPSPLVRFRTQGHRVAFPPVVNLLKLRVSVETTAFPAAFALAPGDVVAEDWFDKVGILSSSFPSGGGPGGVLAPIPPPFPFHHYESPPKASDSSSWKKRLTFGWADGGRKSFPVRASRGYRLSEMDRDELDQALNFIPFFSLPHPDDPLRHDSEDLDSFIEANASRMKEAHEAFLHAVGLRYDGPPISLSRHVRRLTLQPTIPVSAIARGLSVSFEEALGLINALALNADRGVGAYVLLWAEPFGELLKPLIRERLEDYDDLAEGYFLVDE
jgi:hypothetical protein